MTVPVRIAVVDKHPLFREGVIQTIGQRGLVVVAMGESAADACRIVEETQPDILLLDITISGEGLEPVRRILRAHPRVRVVALTAADDEEIVAEALNAGVQGYILKGVSGAELVSAIQAINRDEPYVTPELASRLLVQRRHKDLSRKQDEVADLGLTEREREMLGCLAKGLTNSEIAAELGVTVRYTKNLLASAYKKMRVHNRVAATIEAQKMGLLSGARV
jgi:DNA-binding NarL/FixJ family response regulator